MDGVIADFVKGYKQAFNRNAYEDDSFTINNFCQKVPNFFAMLPVNDKGLELFNHLKNDYNIVFLTTPMDRMPYCKVDKIDWIRENLGEYNVIFSDNKAEFVVDSESILIDDMDKNIKEWEENGGTGILFSKKLNHILSIIKETFDPIVNKKELLKVKINSDPTENQKISGNYLKGNIEVNNLKIKIENVPGSIRWGFSEIGQKWITKMSEYYGYITGTIGSDNDPVDVFINPKGVNRSLVFVINQSKDDGMFDEVKCMIGYKDEEESKKAYLKNYTKGWEKNIISIKRTNTRKLRDWLENGNYTEAF